MPRGIALEYQVPYLGKDKIAAIAESVREKYAGNGYPVNPELICESLNLPIISLPRLKRFFSVDAYITGDFSRIWVDDEEFKKNSPRNRFSISHELGHYFLHRDFYPKELDNAEKLLDYSDVLSNRKAEFQANYFAASLLCPEEELNNLLIKFFGSSFVENFWKASQEERFNGLNRVAKHFGLSLESTYHRVEDCYPELQKYIF